MAGAQAQAAPDPTMETRKQVNDGSEAARAAEWEGKSTTMSCGKVATTFVLVLNENPALAKFTKIGSRGSRYSDHSCTRSVQCMQAISAPRYWPLVPDGKGYLSANQDSDVKSNRIESSHVKKKKWYKTYRRMHMYYFSGLGTHAGEIA